MLSSEIDLLNSLLPTESPRVYDLVEEAGVDVSPWAVRNDGGVVEAPASNPAYCYDWSFSGEGQPTVVNLWHGKLRVKGGVVEYEGNLRLINSSIALSNASKASKAINFDRRIRVAAQKQTDVRVIIADGEIVSDDELGTKNSTVKKRLLDESPWRVSFYNDRTGDFVIARIVPGVRHDNYEEPSSSNVAVDQFDVPRRQGYYSQSIFVYCRSPKVRKHALDRSKGYCEYCGHQGFVLPDGRIFLETHHVISLAEGGPDVVWNVVALCPNDHRKAHFGTDRDAIGKVLLERLEELEPIVLRN